MNNVFVLLIILAAGFVALIKGADIFVDGSSSLAKNLKVPSLIIGLTIVALGTSAPELAVSTSAAIQKSNEIALSNVIGSNLFNLLMVAGICAVISPLPVDISVIRRDMPFSIVCTVLLLIASCAAAFTGGSNLFANADFSANIGLVSRIIGLSLLIVFIGYIAVLIKTAGKNKTEESDEVKRSLRKCILLIIIGLILIVAGGQAVVISAKAIARIAGMTETLIGLTVVALGTSLPELVTSIVAARKGETELAVGNVVGSNIFNLLLILGVSSLVNPVAVNLASLCDLVILILVSVLVYIFMLISKKITRLQGLLMVVLYIADVVFAFFR